MSSRLLALWFACSLAFLPALALAQGAQLGAPAPALTFKDLDGREVRLADFKGKVVVVDFWATWCGPCKAEIPGYIQLQKKYGPAGLVIIGVSLDEAGPKRVKRFAEQNGMNYAVVMGDQEAIDAFGGFDGIPTTFLISREGKIIHQKTGMWAHADYEALVKKAL